MRRPLVIIYDLATDPVWISFYIEEKFLFFFGAHLWKCLLQEMLEEEDHDKDGVIKWEEFRRMLTSKQKGRAPTKPP